MKFTCAIVLAAALLQVGATAHAQDPRPGRVVGTIFTVVRGIRGVRVPNGTVRFVAKGRQFSVSANDEGRFDAQLSPGTYRIEFQSPGFCGVARGAVAVRESAVVTVNARLYPCGLANVLLPNGDGDFVEYCHYVDVYNTVELGVSSALDESRWLMIRYGKCRQMNGFARFTPPEADRQTVHQVVATLDSVTVYADTLEFDTSRTRLRARGSVLLEIDGRETTAPFIELDLLQALPSVVTSTSASVSKTMAN